MGKIKCSDKVTNEEVLRRVDKKRSILNTGRHRIANWIGHVLRKRYWLYDSIQRRKKLQILLLNNLKEIRKHSDLKEEANTRAKWKAKFTDLPLGGKLENNNIMLRQYLNPSCYAVSELIRLRN